MYHKFHPLKVYDLLIIVTELYNHHLDVSPGYFHHFKKSLIPIDYHSHSSFSSGRRSFIFCLHGVAFSGHIIKMESCRMWPFMSPFITQHNIFEIHSCCSLNQCLTLFHGCVMFHCMDEILSYLFVHLLMAMWAISTFWF